MKASLLTFAVFFAASSAQAQSNSAAQAAQAAAAQATAAAQQASAQASQQAMADMQRAVDSTTRANQKAMDDLSRTAAQNNTPAIAFTLPPKISLKGGTYSAPVTVKLSSRTRGAIMYYSTDGWTPTVNSARYLGPITIDATTTLRVIAVAPYSTPSAVVSAVYNFPGSTPSANQPAAAAPDGAQPVRLLFAKAVDSRTAEIGDKIPMTLADDLVLNGSVVAHKGAPASVTIIQVDKTGAAGAPGNLEFQIDPLPTDAGAVKLRGSAALQGKASPPNPTVLIPVVGLFTLFHHGHDAVIPVGTPFTAFLNPASLVATALP
jgi:hypothetical protein